MISQTKYILTTLLICPLLASCTRYVYVPVYKKHPNVKIEKDTAAPILSISKDSTQAEKVNSVISSYKLCEKRKSYLESVLNGIEG